MPPLSEALQMRPADSPVPAPWAPTWHLEHFAWRTSVPSKSQLTSNLSIVDRAATMGTCNFDPFGHLSHVSLEPRSCYSEGASAAVTHLEHRGRSRSGSQRRPSTSPGSAEPSIFTAHPG